MMSFGQGLPFDRIFEMIKEQMRKAGIELSEEEFARAMKELQNFSQNLGETPQSGFFSTRIEVGPDGTPKFQFGFSDDGDPQNVKVHMDSEGYIEPYVEVMNYKDNSIIVAELPDAAEDSLRITQKEDTLEIYAVSPFGEFRKTFDMSKLARRELKAHSFKNNILEIEFV